jgi:hypothetical protein
MNKYYLRFNPRERRNPDTKSAWIVMEITENSTTQHYAESVSIEVNAFTERSFEDMYWWNVACRGFLIKEGTHFRIVSSL